MVERIVNAVFDAVPYWDLPSRELFTETVEKMIDSVVGKDSIIKLLLEIIEMQNYHEKCRQEEREV